MKQHNKQSKQNELKNKKNKKTDENFDDFVGATSNSTGSKNSPGRVTCFSDIPAWVTTRTLSFEKHTSLCQLCFTQQKKYQTTKEHKTE